MSLPPFSIQQIDLLVYQFVTHLQSDMHFIHTHIHFTDELYIIHESAYGRHLNHIHE